MTKTDSHAVSLSLDFGSVTVATVETVDELFEAFRLRDRAECDEYDLMADHLVAKRKADGRVLGACRLLCSRFTDRFEDRDISRSPGVKLELGRVNLAAGAAGASLAWPLWRGVARYAALVGADRVFGRSADWDALVPASLRASLSRAGFLTALDLDRSTRP